MEERTYWLAFSNFQGIGPIRFQLLLEKFWSAENAWNATESELKHSGIGDKLSEEFLAFRHTFHPGKYAESLAAKHIDFIIQKDEIYPTLLGVINNPPFVLYTKGDKRLLGSGKKLLAVVGTRKITDYGRQVTQTLVEDLTAAGCVIVSGLAMGVDAVAHATAMTARGKTIAVLGCGVDCCYPQENGAIYDEILESDGVIISEYPPGMPPSRGSFPSRNRIIAGLSEGVLVTEGAEDSGSLITAKDALKNNRQVFAVPGPITSSVSRGPIALIAKGAVMVTSAKDILKQLGIQNRELGIKKKKITGDTVDEQKVLDLLQNENLHFDALVKQTNLSSSALGTLLSIMEVKGKIVGLDAGMFGLGA